MADFAPASRGANNTTWELPIYQDGNSTFPDMDAFCGSTFWDWNATWYTEDPHLSRCFQLTVLVWVPCGFLWLVGPLEALTLARSSARRIPWTWLNASRLIGVMIMVLISSMDTGYEARQLVGSRRAAYPADYIAPTIRMLTFALAGALGVWHRARGLRSSGALFFFWLLLVLCGVPQLRDEVLSLLEAKDHPFRSLSFSITWAAAVLQLLMTFFPDAAPAVSGRPPQENPCPEESASFPSKYLYSWCTRIIWKGFRRPLELSDLWTLRPQDSTREVFPPFRAQLQRSARRKPRATNCASSEPNGTVVTASTDKPKATSVLPAIVRCFGPYYLLSSILRVLQVALKFAAPALLSALIKFTENDEPVWRGYVYAVALMVAAGAETVVYGLCNRITSISGMRVHTALVAAIYKKALRLSSAARKEATAGEIVNLMSVDAHRFLDVSSFLNIAWSAPLEITIALVLMWQQLGLAVLASLGAVLLLVPLALLVMGRLEKLEGRQMKHKDHRVKIMTEILAGIRVLKLYAWEPSFEERVQSIRGKEQVVLRARAIMSACMSLLWICAPSLMAVVSFTTYVVMDKSHVLDAEKVFVSLALINMIRIPLVMIPHLIVTGIQVRVSLGRINKYINAEELDPASVSHDSFQPAALSVSSGAFAWSEGEPPSLRGVELSVLEGQLAAVVGPVGSGKSSLLSALLGEMRRVQGKVNTKGTIAYVPQQAWIQNATLKDNILFGRPLDARRYAQVLDACALRPDLDILPGGDLTEIGEKGINLSGGQKQRVSLARAVYADADVYLLDDPLSAVDSHVGKQLFQEVIGHNGMLREKARVLVTHAVTYLPETDHVYVMKDGELSQSGSYAELLARGGTFAEFLQQHTQSGQSGNKEDEDEKGGMGDVSKVLKRLASKDTDDGEANEGQGDTLFEDEHLEKGRVSWHIYWLYARNMGIVFAMGTLVSNIIYQGFALGSGAWLAHWSSLGANQELALYISVYAALSVGYSVMSMMVELMPQLGGWQAACELHRSLLHRVLRAPLSFFDTTPAGRVLARFSRDIEVVDTDLPGEVAGSTICTCEILGILIIISYTTPLFLIPLGPVLVMYIFIQQVYVSTTRQVYRLENIAKAPVYSHFGETIAGASTIRAFERRRDFEEESEKRVDTYQRCYFVGLAANWWMEVRVEAVGHIVTFMAALFAVMGRGHLSPGLVGLSLSFAVQCTSLLNWLVQIMSNMERSIVAVERIDEFCHVPQEAAWDVQTTRNLSQWPESGEVCFNDLKLRYREGLELVLHGITFCVKPGEKVGIVGRTGAGKSSLTLALFRLVEAAGGNITVDGVDAAKIGLHALRSRITIIPQEPVLFSGSLRSNLDPFERHSDAELWRALELAHLRSFVETLAAGLQHEVVEGGENLSVGQRQLVCLARALLRKSKVLVLDEATAAVDLETDDLIQRTIRTEFANYTVLTIAHRINTIMDCDRVLVLSEGHVLEFDSPTELLQRPDSAFYSMAQDAGLA